MAPPINGNIDIAWIRSSDDRSSEYTVAHTNALTNIVEDLVDNSNALTEYVGDVPVGFPSMGAAVRDTMNLGRITSSQLGGVPVGFPSMGDAVRDTMNLGRITSSQLGGVPVGFPSMGYAVQDTMGLARATYNRLGDVPVGFLSMGDAVQDTRGLARATYNQLGDVPDGFASIGAAVQDTRDFGRTTRAQLGNVPATYTDFSSAYTATNSTLAQIKEFADDGLILLNEQLLKSHSIYNFLNNKESILYPEYIYINNNDTDSGVTIIENNKYMSFSSELLFNAIKNILTKDTIINQNYNISYFGNDNFSDKLSISTFPDIPFTYQSISTFMRSTYNNFRLGDSDIGNLQKFVGFNNYIYSYNTTSTTYTSTKIVPDFFFTIENPSTDIYIEYNGRTYINYINNDISLDNLDLYNSLFKVYPSLKYSNTSTNYDNYFNLIYDNTLFSVTSIISDYYILDVSDSTNKKVITTKDIVRDTTNFSNKIKLTVNYTKKIDRSTYSKTFFILISSVTKITYNLPITYNTVLNTFGESINNTGFSSMLPIVSTSIINTLDNTMTNMYKAIFLKIVMQQSILFNDFSQFFTDIIKYSFGNIYSFLKQINKMLINYFKLIKSLNIDGNIVIYINKLIAILTSGIKDILTFNIFIMNLKLIFTSPYLSPTALALAAGAAATSNNVLMFYLSKIVILHQYIMVLQSIPSNNIQMKLQYLKLIIETINILNMFNLSTTSPNIFYSTNDINTDFYQVFLPLISLNNAQTFYNNPGSALRTLPTITFTINGTTLNFTCNDGHENNNLQFRFFTSGFTTSSKLLTYNNTSSTYNINFGTITPGVSTKTIIIDVINNNYEYFGFRINCTIFNSNITAINAPTRVVNIPLLNQSGTRFYNPITNVHNFFCLLVNPSLAS